METVSDFPPIYINEVNVAAGLSFKIPLSIHLGKITVQTWALLNSSAQANFISPNFIAKYNIPLFKLVKPIPVRNADNSPNKGGAITHTANLALTADGKKMEHLFYVSNIGKKAMIIGLPFLQDANLDINWWKKTVSINKQTITMTDKCDFDPEDHIQGDFLPSKWSIKRASYAYDCKLKLSHMALSINVKTSEAQHLHQQYTTHKKNVDIEELVLKKFHKYIHLFKEKEANHFPLSRNCNHKIKLKEDFMPEAAKLYRLSEPELRELHKFIDENLEKGYICPSKSPQAAPFFFIQKKDRKLRPVQDYWYLNKHTIKNAYPIPSIDSILDWLKGAVR